MARPLFRAFWEGRLFVQIEAYPPDKRMRDIDNLAKCVLDALQTARVFENDYQIDRLLIERKEVMKPGKLFVSILEIV